MRRVADFYQGSNLIVGAKNRIARLTLRATDTDWVHGAGPEVTGPLLPLVLAMTGRRAALMDLTGDGLEALATRMPDRPQRPVRGSDLGPAVGQPQGEQQVEDARPGAIKVRRAG